MGGIAASILSQGETRALRAATGLNQVPPSSPHTLLSFKPVINRFGLGFFFFFLLYSIRQKNQSESSWC